MRLRNIELDDNEDPKIFTFEVTVDEAALLYAVMGHIAPAALTEASGDVRWGNAGYDMGDCLAAAFNRFYEVGPHEVVPDFFRWPLKEDS